jgi:predicted amidophosphoribosyltransferase
MIYAVCAFCQKPIRPDDARVCWIDAARLAHQECEDTWRQAAGAAARVPPESPIFGPLS